MLCFMLEEQYMLLFQNNSSDFTVYIFPFMEDSLDTSLPKTKGKESRLPFPFYVNLTAYFLI